MRHEGDPTHPRHREKRADLIKNTKKSSAPKPLIAKGILGQFLQILGDPPQGEFVLEPRLDGPKTWGWLDGKPVPETASRIPFLYTQHAELADALEKAKMLGGKTYRDVRDGQEIFKIRLKDTIAADYIAALKNAGRPVVSTGYSETSLYPLRARLKGATSYYATQFKGGPALLVHSTQKSVDALIEELRGNGLLPKQSGPNELQIRMLSDGSWAVALPVTPTFMAMIQRTAENQITPLSDVVKDTAYAQAQRQANLANHLMLFNASRSSPDTATSLENPLSDGRETAEVSQTERPSGSRESKREPRALAEDASLLANTLVFTRKRMADGSVQPFIQIDQKRLPKGLDWIELRRRLMPRGNYYREVLPSFESHAGGLIMQAEDRDRLLSSLNGFAIRRSDEILPYEVHETMRRRLTDIRNPDYANLLGGVVTQAGERHYYLYVRYQNASARPFLPLGSESKNTAMTKPDERPRIERIEVPASLWQDISTQLEIRMLAGGADFISQEALQVAVREAFPVRTLTPDEVTRVGKGRHRRIKSERDTPLEEVQNPVDQDQAYSRALEIVKAFSPQTKDDQSTLLLGQKPLLLPDEEAEKARNKARKQAEDAYRESLKEKNLTDGELKRMVRAYRVQQGTMQEANPIPSKEHTYFAIRGLAERLDNVESLLEDAGLLQRSLTAPAVGGESTRLFVLKSDERSAQFVATLRSASPVQTEFDGMEMTKAGPLASRRFQELDEEFKQRQQDPIKNFVSHLSGRQLLQARVKQPSPEEVRRNLGAVGKYKAYLAGAGIIGFDQHVSHFDEGLPSDVRLHIASLPGMVGRVRELEGSLDVMHAKSILHASAATAIESSLAKEEAWAEQVKFDPVIPQWFIVNPSPYTRKMLTDASIRALMLREPVTFAEAGPQSSDILSIYPNNELQRLLMRARSGHLPMLDAAKKEIPFSQIPDALRTRFRPPEEEEKEYTGKALTLEDRFNRMLEAFHERRAMLAYEKPNDPPPLGAADLELLKTQREFGVEASSQLGSMPVLLVSIERKQQFERLQQMMQEMNATDANKKAFMPKRFFGEGLVKTEWELPKGPAECYDLLRDQKRLEEEISVRKQALEFLVMVIIDEEPERQEFGRTAFRRFVSEHPELFIQASELADEERWGGLMQRLRDQRNERQDKQHANQELIEQKDMADMERARVYLRQNWAFTLPVKEDEGGASLYAMNGQRLDSYDQLLEHRAQTGQAMVKLYLTEEMAAVIEDKYRNEANDLFRSSRFVPRNGPTLKGSASELAEKYADVLSGKRTR